MIPFESTLTSGVVVEVGTASEEEEEKVDEAAAIEAHERVEEKLRARAAAALP